MRFIIFGLSISSSWGNGHATLWRSLLKAMAARGHSAVFYEKDVPYYASTRDGWLCPKGIQLLLYNSLDEVRAEALREMSTADVALSTSYCPEGGRAAEMIWESEADLKAFYDLDTPVTLRALSDGERVEYLPADGLSAFDLVLSFTGGRALEELRTRLGARRVAPLYGSFDPDTHHFVAPVEAFQGALSYLGTYAADRQAKLEELLIEPATRMPNQRFLIAGAQYPENFPWQDNIAFVRHLEPSQHPAFLCSSRATLNVTRGSMADYGHCPSGRLFEAAACRAAILSDSWEGLDSFFVTGSELVRVGTAEDVMAALSLSNDELRRIGEAACERAFACHTAVHRVVELEAACEAALSNRNKAAIAA
jgi:spore maturation protein CgeB